MDYLLLDNRPDNEDEPEDAVLVASMILPKLIKEARGVSPSADWERDHDEL